MRDKIIVFYLSVTGVLLVPSHPKSRRQLYCYCSGEGYKQILRGEVRGRQIEGRADSAFPGYFFNWFISPKRIIFTLGSFFEND